MKKAGFIFLTFIVAACSLAQDKPCTEIKQPAFSDSVKIQYEQKLLLAKQQYAKDTTDADATIWYGRRMAYTGKYMEAIAIFSKGISIHPHDARFYRHRGHRYITVRCFDKAIEDLEKAGRLIKGQQDEVEPDGLPNAKNITTSTLQSNTWYHLGLAYFVKAEYSKAIKAYKKCLAVSQNPDMYVATANWMNIALRQKGKVKKATALYYSIDWNAALLESGDYRNLLELYRDQPGTNEIDHHYAIDGRNKNALSNATTSFGVGFYCLLNGEKEKAKDYFEKALATGQWASFGYIAAEAELLRIQKQKQ